MRLSEDLGPFFQFWTFHITVMLLLPLMIAARRPGMWEELRHGNRRALFLVVGGMLGVCQFLAVHTEPRLIAPFVLLFALGAVDWLSRYPLDLPAGTPVAAAPAKGKGAAKHAAPASPAPMPARGKMPGRIWAALAFSVGWAFVYGWTTMADGFRLLVSDIPHLQRIQAQVAQQVPPGTDHPRIVLIGPASVEMLDAWEVEGRVLAQVIRPSLAVLNKWPQPKQQELVQRLSALPADLIWVTLPDKSLGMIPVRPGPR